MLFTHEFGILAAVTLIKKDAKKLLLQGIIVITSYSIHYTKLYDIDRVPPTETLPGSLDTLVGEALGANPDVLAA